PLQDLPDPQRQRLPGNAFFLHRRFRQIFHVLILRYLLIATEPLYLDEAGFCASPPVQRSWSPRGPPHEIEPNTHCRRNVVGALDFGSNTLIHATHASSVKGPDVARF
ncbi:hypothetical protein V4C53_47730, partial [Paraburkholderia azotifigens]